MCFQHVVFLKYEWGCERVHDAICCFDRNIKCVCDIVCYVIAFFDTNLQHLKISKLVSCVLHLKRFVYCTNVFKRYVV